MFTGQAGCCMQISSAFLSSEPQPSSPNAMSIATNGGKWIPLDANDNIAW